MRRYICFFLLFSMLFPLSAHAADSPLPVPSVAAPSAILMEKNSGQIIYSKDPMRHYCPASVTKIMTMLLIVEDIAAGQLSLDDTVIASARAASFGGSCVFLAEGERMSVHEMLKCIAVVSANDCAVAMAEHISGSEQEFVRRMNLRAAELGLRDTNFTNCTGLKTGYTSKAGYCLSATAERDGVEYIAVVMHSESADSRNADAEALLNHAFANYTLCPLKLSTPPPVRVDMGVRRYVSTALGGEDFALVPRSAGAAEYSLSVEERVSAPVRAGDKLGVLIVRQNGKAVAKLPVLAAEEVPRLGFGGIFARLGLSMLGL